MKRLVLPEMSWPEMAKYQESVELALIPVGSQEQHGPNMTFATDAERAYETSKLLGERLFPRVVVCAPVNYGVSYHHMKFPGTLTMQPETLIAVLMDIAWSLKEHGIKKILMVNAHGGNRASLSMAAVKMRFQLGIQAAFIGSGTDLSKDLLEEKGASQIRGHACEGEVSQGMFLAPWIVKADALAPGELKDTPYQKRLWWGEVPWSFDEITANGALGDATKASYELGREMSVLVLDRLEAFIREYYFQDENAGVTKI